MEYASISYQFHPSIQADSSCSRCGKPTCNACLTLKKRFFIGSSRLCRLCYLYERASNVSAGVAVVVFIVVGVIIRDKVIPIFLGFDAFASLIIVLRHRARQEIKVEVKK